MLANLSTLNPEAIVQSDTTEYTPPLQYLAVFAVNGTIAVKNELNETVTFTIPDVAAGGGAPFILPGRFRQILDSGTTIADAAMIGYRAERKKEG